MSESNFYEKLEILKKQFKDVPQNVLILQLKESNGDLQQCILRLNNTDNILPELSVQRHYDRPRTQPHPLHRGNNLSSNNERNMYKVPAPPHYDHSQYSLPPLHGNYRNFRTVPVDFHREESTSGHQMRADEVPVSVPWQPSALTPLEDKTLTMQRFQLQQIEKINSDLQRRQSLMMKDVREKQIELSQLKKMNNQNSIDEDEIYFVQSITETLRDDIDRAKSIYQRQKSAQLLQSKIQAHIKEEGELNISVAKGILYGPPRVGKTSLMKRLIGEKPEPPEKCESSGIEPPITVPIYEDSQFVPVAIQHGRENDEWQRLNLKETLKVCLNFFLPTDEPKERKPPTEPPVKSKGFNTVSKETSSPANIDDCVIISEKFSDLKSTSTDKELNDKTMAIPRPLEMPTDVAQNVTDSINDDTGIKENDSVDFPAKIVDFIKNEDWMSVREKLKGFEEMTLFQVIDVGGQPEFHDILPLLLTGPAIYLLFFNLNQELDQIYTYLYQHEDGSTSGAYKSQLTVFQVLHQILSSISSMSEFSPAIVIGTHLDQLKSTDGKEFTWKPTDDPLKDRMKEHFYYEKSLIPNQVDGEYCVVFPVDNINGTLEDEIKPLRLKIKAKLNELKGTSLPTSWALFYYLLRSIDDNEDPKYCTLDEAKSLAEGLKIKDVETVLKYFHERFGSVLYYHDVEDKDCNKYVFRDANVILRAVNELVAICFGSNPKHMRIVEKLRATGIVTQDKFDILCRSFSDKRLCSYVTELLKSRHILSSVSVKGTDRYFIPCLLHSCDDTKYPPLPQNEKVAPLLLKLLHKDDCDESFSFIPPGLFSSTLVKLSNESGWELLDDSRFKNKVTFSCSNRSAFLSITLIAKDKWIEVHVNEEPTSLTPSCNNIKKAIEKAITVNESDTLLGQFLQLVKLNVGFYCQENKHYASMKNETQMFCISCCHKYQPLMDKHKIWFEESNGATSNVNNPLLDIIMSKAPTLNELTAVLADISYEWEFIGIALDVERHRIKSIKNEEREDKAKLLRILEEWIDNSEDVTWRAILKAVQQPNVNKKSHVKKINEFLLKLYYNNM